MKKILSIALCLVLLLSMSTTAFAAESGDIKVTYSQPNPEKVTIVDLTWGSMEFNYNSGDKKVWNPEKLEYEIVEGEEGDASWTPANEGGDTVTVTNHSNTGLLVTVAYTPAPENGVTGSVENGTFFVATAVGTERGNAPKGSAKLTLDASSVPTTWNETGATTIGSVTVTLEQYDAIPGTVDEMSAALVQGGKIILMNDLNPAEMLSIEDGVEVVLDLNGHNMTCNMNVIGVTLGTLTVRGNGNISSEDGNGVAGWGSTMNIHGGNISALLVHLDSIANIYGGSIDLLKAYIGIVNISGGYVGAIELQSGTYQEIHITGGTFGFDPSAYVDTANYTITANGDGTWTVTEN